MISRQPNPLGNSRRRTHLNAAMTRSASHNAQECGRTPTPTELTMNSIKEGVTGTPYSDQRLLLHVHIPVKSFSLRMSHFRTLQTLTTQSKSVLPTRPPTRTLHGISDLLSQTQIPIQRHRCVSAAIILRFFCTSVQS